MVIMLNSCTTPKNSENKVQHIVMCWLKKDASSENFIKAVKELKSIPQVKGISIGKKVNSIEPVADNSFDLAFTITFESQEDLKIYLEHPDHQNAVKSILIPSLEKVVVYDYLEL
jgi:hypothetical protein